MDIFSTCSLCVSDLHRIKFNNVYRVCFDNVIDAEKIIYDIIAKLEQTKGAFLAKVVPLFKLNSYIVFRNGFSFISPFPVESGIKITNDCLNIKVVYIFDASTMSMALMLTVQALIRM